MRKKSPASIQKWVNSVSSEACASEPVIGETNEPPVEVQPDILADCDISDELAKYSNNEILPESTNEPATEPVTQTETDTSANENKKPHSYHENLKEIGKQKINEFYDRFSKNKKIDLKNLFQTSVSKKHRASDIMETEVKQEDPGKKEELASINENKENIIIEEEDVEIQGEPEKISCPTSSSCLSVSKNLSIGIIGRSSSENPQTKSSSKRFRLNDIGRSFSVQEPEDPKKATLDSSDNLIYDIDDESSSKSNLAPSLATSSRSINSNNNLNSYVKSVPISPINRSFREELLSESHSPRNLRSAFLRDSSFQVRKFK